MRTKLLLAILGLCAISCFAQQVEENKVVLVKKKGTVLAWNEAAKKWEDLAVNAQIKVKTYVKTEKDSEAIVTFGRKAVTTIGENSAVQIAESTFDKGQIKKVKILAPRGKVWSVVDKLPTADAKFEIETPNALAGVRGTVFSVNYTPTDNSSRVAVVTGEVRVSSAYDVEKFVILKENMSTVVVANKPPVPPQMLEEREKQEWEQWKQNIPFAQIGAIGGIAEMNAMQVQEASRIVRELGIAKKGSAKAQKDFEDIADAILVYFGDTGTVPGKLRDLLENPGVSNWKGPYLGAGTNFQDPYGHRYFYYQRTSPSGKKYLEIKTAGLIGAAGDTYGEESKIIFVDKIPELLKKKLAQPAGN